MILTAAKELYLFILLLYEEQEFLKYIENALSLINKLTKMGEMYESEEE